MKITTQLSLPVIAEHLCSKSRSQILKEKYVAPDGIPSVGWLNGFSFITSTARAPLRGVPREQKMLKGHLPRYVIKYAHIRRLTRAKAFYCITPTDFLASRLTRDSLIRRGVSAWWCLFPTFQPRNPKTSFRGSVWEVDKP